MMRDLERRWRMIKEDALYELLAFTSVAHREGERAGQKRDKANQEIFILFMHHTDSRLI